MKVRALTQYVKSGKLDAKIVSLYGKDQCAATKKRIVSLCQKAYSLYGDKEATILSAPGRTEVGGNHTDHQLGRVLAASISLDVLAVVCPTKDDTVRYWSKGFTVKPVSLKVLKPQAKEKNSTEALIRGTAARMKSLGYKIGGFQAVAQSNVLPGSGMSSSAAFEVLLGTIFNECYNKGKVDPVTIAKVGQYAENVFFGKPCGLLDQMACSVGGFVTIDFKDATKPKVEKIPFDFSKSGYQLILTDCRQSHADLSDEYGKIPGEMKQVARVLGKQVLSQCTFANFVKKSPLIRKKCGDRAWLRAYHFLKETDRVLVEVKALKKKEMPLFLSMIKESGHSSYMYLQNVYPPNDLRHQSLAVGLALSEDLLEEKGAYRVHGGGFAGTIQAFVPKAYTKKYCQEMESIFGKNCCYVLSIRPVGGIRLI